MSKLRLRLLFCGVALLHAALTVVTRFWLFVESWKRSVDDPIGVVLGVPLVPLLHVPWLGRLFGRITGRYALLVIIIGNAVFWGTVAVKVVRWRMIGRWFVRDEVILPAMVVISLVAL